MILVPIFEVDYFVKKLCFMKHIRTIVLLTNYYHYCANTNPGTDFSTGYLCGCSNTGTIGPGIFSGYGNYSGDRIGSLALISFIIYIVTLKIKIVKQYL